DLVERVQPCRFGGGEVTRNFIGTAYADGSCGFRRCEDRVAVGGDRDHIDATCSGSLQHRPGDQRLAADVEQVLVRNALGAASRGDHGQRSPRRLSAHMRPSRRSSAVQKPSPMFLWPCHISGIKEASGACRRSTPPIWSKSISPSPTCRPSPSRPLASPKCRCALCGPSCASPSAKSKPK